MLNEGKTPIKIDYSDEYVALKNLVEALSNDVRTLHNMEEMGGIPWCSLIRIFFRKSLMDVSSILLSGISFIFLLPSRLKVAGGASSPRLVVPSVSSCLRVF
jgi:hypothetical protein